MWRTGGGMHIAREEESACGTMGTTMTKHEAPQEPQDASSDDDGHSVDVVHHALKKLQVSDHESNNNNNNSSFARTVSSSNDSLHSEDEDEEVTLTPDEALDNNQEADTTVNGTESVEWELSLQDENARLRSQVADLTSALVARDMEIASLRERCQFLMNAVEQQDEVIAKIYAVASPAASPPTQQPAGVTARPIPIPQATSNASHLQHLQHLQQKAEVAPATKRDAAKKATSSSSSKTDSVRRYPGMVGRVEPVREMLEAHFDSIGYRQQNAGDDIESLSEGIERETGSTTMPATGESEADALDRFLFASPPKTTAPLFIDSLATSRHEQDNNYDHRAALVGSPLDRNTRHHARSLASQRSPFLERRGSIGSDDVDFAKSAGFLRKANRKLSGRLSVSDFGLLGDDDTASIVGGGVSRSLSNGSDNQSEESAGSESSTTRRTASQRNLFAEIDVREEEEAKRKKKNKSSTRDRTRSDGGSGAEKDERELTYAEFLERISLPSSRDLLDSIRVFIGSILGPRGDGKPPRSTDYLDYDFYGHHEFQRRYEQFFESMDDRLSTHPAWRHVSESMLAKARDGIEKYVMDKLSDIAFNQLPECQQWKNEDERLFRRMKLLSFIMPDMLDIKPCMRNEVVWSMAEDELRRINSFRAPGDKINCIVRCCSVIFSVLNLSRGSDNDSRPGADDFLPVFIYIVLHSQIPRLVSNCEYIAAYRNPADLMSNIERARRSAGKGILRLTAIERTPSVGSQAKKTSAHYRRRDVYMLFSDSDDVSERNCGRNNDGQRNEVSSAHLATIDHS
ncbi:Vacuolar assembly/sorting protein vps9, partial [Globisporangium splendens]